MAHHYLDVGPMPFSTAFVAFVDDMPVAHLGMTTIHVGAKETSRFMARACRLVVMPEWQGAGIGLRFLNLMCEREWRGEGFAKIATPTVFHTAHPALLAALRRDPHWSLISARVTGWKAGVVPGKGVYGGHWRPVAGWRYRGDDPAGGGPFA